MAVPTGWADCDHLRSDMYDEMRFIAEDDALIRCCIRLKGGYEVWFSRTQEDPRGHSPGVTEFSFMIKRVPAAINSPEFRRKELCQIVTGYFMDKAGTYLAETVVMKKRREMYDWIAKVIAAHSFFALWGQENVL